VTSKRSSRTGLASGAALLLAAGGLAAYVVGEQAGSKAPEQVAPARAGKAGQAPARSRPVPELVVEAPYRGYSTYPAPAGGADPAPGAAGEEPDATREIMKAMEKLVSDLEYNSNRGLKEPPQQVVGPYPDPWRPPAEAAALPAPVIDQVTPARASTRGGTKVTLRGKNLRTPEVMFGASPASVVGGSDTEVTVVAPPSPAGPVTIAVTNADGTYALVGSRFTYAD
jgi:hypothetical protein